MPLLSRACRISLLGYGALLAREQSGGLGIPLVLKAALRAVMSELGVLANCFGDIAPGDFRLIEELRKNAIPFWRHALAARPNELTLLLGRDNVPEPNVREGFPSYGFIVGTEPRDTFIDVARNGIVRATRVEQIRHHSP